MLGGHLPSVSRQAGQFIKLGCGGWSQKHRPNDTQNFGVRQIDIRTLAPRLAVGKFLLPCISLHICEMGLILASSCGSIQ